MSAQPTLRLAVLSTVLAAGFVTSLDAFSVPQDAERSAYKVICVDVLPDSAPLPEVCVVDPTS